MLPCNGSEGEGTLNAHVQIIRNFSKEGNWDGKKLDGIGIGMGLQTQESAREGGDREGKMWRDRPNQVGNTARQSLPASGGEGTQRVPNKVTTNYLVNFLKLLEQTAK